MPRARWWVIGALSVVTLSVVTLDATGVIFTEAEAPVPAPPVVVPALPNAAAAVPAAVEPGPLVADPRIVRDVKQALESDALGPSVHGFVAPLGEPNSPWVDFGGEGLATPASTLKLWTAAAVLDAVPSNERLSTDALWDSASGTVILVGGGDATLETDPGRASDASSLTELATVTAKKVLRANEGSLTVRIGYDSTAFTGPTVSPEWEPTYVSSA